MGHNSGKNGKDGFGGDDAALWADFTQDIKPISKKRGTVPEKTAPRSTAKSTPKARPKTIERAPVKSVPTKQPPQLDSSTQNKLEKGKIPIEGRLDLHGMNQAQAQDALEAFVLRAAKAQKRCLLVITGKGLNKNGEGVLRQRLPQWIALAPLGDIILKAVPAAPKDGGSGAFYLYLKRQR